MPHLFGHDDLDSLVASFPESFYLLAHDGRFTVNRSASYISGGRAVLYVFTEAGEAFCKGSYAEIRSQMA
jgi:hypothetical protein